MNAGKMKDVINIRTPQSTSRSTDGGKITTYTTTIENLWAEVKPIGASEIFLQNQTYTDIDMQFITRYSSLITKTNQLVVLGSDIYEIQGIIDVDYKHIELNILGRLLK